MNVKGLNEIYIFGTSAGIRTELQLDEWSSIPGTACDFFTPPPLPDRLWDPPSLLSNGYQGSYPEGKVVVV
jgi:hypothetical protein